MLRALTAALALLLLCLAGCKGSCRKLSEELCECAPNSLEKDACLKDVSQREASVTLTAEDEARCKALLPSCDCHTADTAEGKRRCGLAN